MDGVPQPPLAAPSAPVLVGAIPILFVRDVAAAADFYEAQLGFQTDFLHGKPPFYASVSRDGAQCICASSGNPTSPSSPSANTR
jgi:catechol 2,3-dioxygenase-like lactoylglutathione lyase family enzyme